MNQEKYNFFKKEQLPIFKAIYKNAGAYRKKELKRLKLYRKFFLN